MGRRLRFGAMFEQAMFVAFMAGVVIFGLYLLFETGEQTTVEDDSGSPDQQTRVISKYSGKQAVTNGDQAAEQSATKTLSDSREAGHAPKAQANSWRWSSRLETLPAKSEAKKETKKQVGTSSQGSDATRAQNVQKSAEKVPASSADASESTANVKPGAERTESSTKSRPEQAKTDSQLPHSAAPDQQQTSAADQNAAETSPSGDEETAEKSAGKDREQVPTATAEPAPKPAPARIHVLRAMFTYGFEGGEPTGRVNYIDYSKIQSGRLYFFTEVNAPEGGRINLEWRHNGITMMEQSFDVRGRLDTSSSSYVIGPNDKGTWRVYIRDGAGKVIKIGSALYR